MKNKLGILSALSFKFGNYGFNICSRQSNDNVKKYAPQIKMTAVQKRPAKQELRKL